MLNNKCSRISLVVAGVVASLVLPTTTVFAQTARLPGVVDKAIPDTEIPSSHSLDSPQADPLEKAPKIKDVTDAKRVLSTLKSVIFTGNTVVKTATLQGAVAKYVGQPMTKGDLAELKYLVKKEFHDRGYILVHVFTPPQDFSKGVLNVSILEATVDDITVNDNGVIRPHLAKSMMKRVGNKQIINESNIETAVTNLDDLSGVKAQLTLSLGEKLGTTDIEVNLNTVNENVNTIALDNYGSDLTGRGVLAAHLEHGNFFKMGEKFNLDLRRSEDDLWSAGGGVFIPTGIKDVNLETNYFYSENDIGGRLKALNASGETNVFNIAFSKKIINNRAKQATVRFGFESRTHESFLANVSDTKDDVRRTYIDTSYLRRTPNSVYYGSVKISKGIDAFGVSEKGDAGASRAAGDPEAWIIEPVLLANFRPLSLNGTVKTLVRGQLASSTLLSSDLFSVGGYRSIRGFDVAQESGEMGYTFSLEYNHNLPIDVNKMSFKAGPFVDGGAVFNRVSGSTEDDHFYSIGLGAEMAADIINAGKTVLRVDWAHPVGGYKATKMSDNSLYFRMNQRF